MREGSELKSIALGMPIQRSRAGQTHRLGRPWRSASCAVHGHTRRNPQIPAFYQRLLSMHKPKKLALIACMHKMLTILNAMVKRQSRWSVPADPLG
jgi:transposase